ncbi:MAG TPA: VOC family protein [Chloroflexota bacterium]|jgi:catechol 2,3-dioxygenase-like lactoylglutathione lyase family enzyme|nr:VOC family protein [Chloroflexota bacterium]
MSITLNHTIVPARDKVAAARFFAELFGLEFHGTQGHFAPVRVNADLTLDFDDAEHFEPHHYAFLVSEEEFDAIFGRVRAAGLDYYAEPGGRGKGQINHRRGGRGVYFADPNGHLYELMTRA